MSFLTSQKRRSSRRRPMFHLNPSSFEDEEVLRRLEISRLRGWKPKVLYSVQLSFCRLRVLDSGSTGEREIDWARRIRQKLIYVQRNSTMYRVHIWKYIICQQFKLRAHARHHVLNCRSTVLLGSNNLLYRFHTQNQNRYIGLSNEC